MCGIVGYTGKKRALPILIGGLQRLEYRGYDSSGVACVETAGSRKRIQVVKEKGKLIRLREKLNGHTFNGTVGIGHTRWATHGEPSNRNAHPHQDGSKKFVLVHNGIIENYEELKKELRKRGHKFLSDTDSEVAVHLIQYYYKGDVLAAFRKAISRMQGFFAFVLSTTYEPETLYVFRRSNPLVIGIGKGENYIASDAPALLPFTRKALYLDDDEIARIVPDKVSVFSQVTGKSLRKKITEVNWSVEQAAKAGYPHFMLKEINEQPEVVANIIKSRVRKKKVVFDSLDAKIEKRLKAVRSVHFVSCGTAYHAGLVGNYMLGACARVPVEATVSSEFRYEDPVVGKQDLVILITQSGETADTLAALREAKAKGALTLAIVNVVGSTIAREADCVIYTHAGPEIGVASTKAYVAQLMVLSLFSIYFGRLRKALPLKESEKLLREIAKLPRQVSETLKDERTVKRAARRLRRKTNFLYLGRGYNFPNALEGALKLKEITYSHAHGYAAGEMKHGPIALIDSNQAVICIAPASKTYDKMLSNIEEIRARKGILVSIATAGDKKVKAMSEVCFTIPKANEFYSPILTVVPLQLFAYHVAYMNGKDVDQPRNLAKSVTVE